MKNILKKLLKIETVYAHCDVPCGIYLELTTGSEKSKRIKIFTFAMLGVASFALPSLIEILEKIQIL